MTAGAEPTRERFVDRAARRANFGVSSVVVMEAIAAFSHSERVSSATGQRVFFERDRAASVPTADFVQAVEERFFGRAHSFEFGVDLARKFERVATRGAARTNDGRRFAAFARLLDRGFGFRRFDGRFFERFGAFGFRFGLCFFDVASFGVASVFSASSGRARRGVANAATRRDVGVSVSVDVASAANASASVRRRRVANAGRASAVPAAGVRRAVADAVSRAVSVAANVPAATISGSPTAAEETAERTPTLRERDGRRGEKRGGEEGERRFFPNFLRVEHRVFLS